MVRLSAPEAALRASEKGTVSLGDISVAFARLGEGQPVIFVHGLAEDKESWSQVVARLPPGVRAHLLDLRGHGGSTVGQGNGTVSQLAGDLAAYLEKVTGPAVCVGFSLGGVVVLEAALQRPDLVRRAVVIGTSSKVGRAAAGFFEARIRQATSDIDGFRRALAEDTDAQVLRNRQELAAIAARRIAAVGDGAGYVNAARAMVGLAAAPMTERLRDIRVPVHIIQGENDAFCPLKAAEILREAMPDAGYAEIPDAGHLIAADQPDLLAGELSRVLAGTIIQSKGEADER
ncbi:MAG: alpha/beta fold hydrolase [Pseudochelatococcus sp.]|uniref:alpha/beta fold hydrolase n=1 Tax=Pseudochelatococcus sp. TaxID=2020869 RepID=UPI003D8EC83F